MREPATDHAETRRLALRLDEAEEIRQDLRTARAEQNERFDAIDRRFEGIDTRLDALGGRLDEHGSCRSTVAGSTRSTPGSGR